MISIWAILIQLMQKTALNKQKFKEFYGHINYFM